MKIIKYVCAAFLALALFFIGGYIGSEVRREYVMDHVRFSGRYYDETIEQAENYLKTLDPGGGIELFPADDCMSIVVRVGPSKILTDEVKAEVERLLDIKYIEKIVPGLSGLE